jgi:hypothetical protein
MARLGGVYAVGGGPFAGLCCHYLSLCATA